FEEEFGNETEDEDCNNAVGPNMSSLEKQVIDLTDLILSSARNVQETISDDLSNQGQMLENIAKSTSEDLENNLKAMFTAYSSDLDTKFKEDFVKILDQELKEKIKPQLTEIKDKLTDLSNLTNSNTEDTHDKLFQFEKNLSILISKLEKSIEAVSGLQTTDIEKKLSETVDIITTHVDKKFEESYNKDTNEEFDNEDEYEDYGNEDYEENENETTEKDSNTENANEDECEEYTNEDTYEENVNEAQFEEDDNEASYEECGNEDQHEDYGNEASFEEYNNETIDKEYGNETSDNESNNAVEPNMSSLEKEVIDLKDLIDFRATTLEEM
ncbi:hypothetical protein Avbf_01679, partial [Armadillidium vulgare]